MTVLKAEIVKAHILHCPTDVDVDCNTPGAKMTDFNMWSGALTERQIADWTGCKYEEMARSYRIVGLTLK